MKRRESTHSIIKIKAFSVLSLTWRGRVVKLKEKRAVPYLFLCFKHTPVTVTRSKVIYCQEQRGGPEGINCIPGLGKKS